MSNNFLQNNYIYRLLNFMQGFDNNSGFTDKQKAIFKQFLEYIVEPIGGEVSDPVTPIDNSSPKQLLYKIKIGNNDEVFDIQLYCPSGTTFSIRMGFQESIDTQQQHYLTVNGNNAGAVTFNNSIFIHGLFFASQRSGGVMSRFYSSTNTQECISTVQSYLIFTWAKDIRTDQSYPCMFVEEVSGGSNLYGYIYNPNDINLDGLITIKLNLSSTLPSCAAYPVLSQATVRFDDYVFPYLFRKETFTEGAFGIRKIQGKRYFLTKYLALEMIEEGENNG